MRYISFLNKIKFWIVSAIALLLLVGNEFAFSTFVDSSMSAYKVWNNTTSQYVALNSSPHSKDSYRYYDNNLFVTLDDSLDTIALNCYSYQFLENCEYSEMSILNEDNIFAGTYSVLKGKEIAISGYASKKYSLKIGSTLFVNEEPYTVKYIFNYMYGIKNANLSSDEDAVFIGSSDSPIEAFDTYAIFNNESKPYSKIYHFNAIKNNFLTYSIVFCSSYFLIDLLIMGFVLHIYKKNKVSNLKTLKLDGDKKNYYKDLFIIDFFVLLIPCCLSLLIGFYFIPSIMTLGTIGLMILIYLLNLVYLRMKTNY